jgi:hypothetical protein
MSMKTLEMHETEAVIAPTGSVRIDDLPFATGDRVRIFVMLEKGIGGRRHSADEVRRAGDIRRGLKGSVIEYGDPTEPMGVEDWDALKDDFPGVSTSD